MQVMLIQDVANLGQVGDIVEVKNGYGRNYLIPQRMAVLATPGAIKQAEQMRSAADKRRVRERATAQDLAAALAALVLRFERKVGERGRLYGSVTSGDIAERLEATLGGEFDRRKIDLDEPIKNLGAFEVPINLHSEVVARVRVEVVGDRGETAADFDAEGEEAERPLVAAYDPQPDADY